MGRRLRVALVMDLFRNHPGTLLVRARGGIKHGSPTTCKYVSLRLSNDCPLGYTPALQIVRRKDSAGVHPGIVVVTAAYNDNHVCDVNVKLDTKRLDFAGLAE